MGFTGVITYNPTYIMAAQPTPPGPRTPPRNSRPYDQGLLTIGFP